MTSAPGPIGRAARWCLARPRLSGLAVAVVALSAAFVAVWGQPASREMTAVVRRGPIAARLTASGTLHPVQSITYRSPLAGRETEVTFLVPEGTMVGEGDLLVRLDAAALERDLERAVQEVRQVQIDVQVADIDWRESQAAIESLTAGEAALTVEEARARLAAAEKKVARLREEHATLQPLMQKGYITRDELRKIADELAQAEEDLTLVRRRADVLIKQTRPQERQRAELQQAQKAAQREHVAARLREAQARVALLRAQIENCSLYARQPGLVVYEEFLNASPRRKIRPGDRVTESQGLVTIPEVTRMQLETSVSEADVSRVRPGQTAVIVLEAYRDRRLTGKVSRVGTLARAASGRPFEDKRFDLVVELDPSDANLRPEMTARVDVLVEEKPGVLLLPLNAIFERDGLPVVHVVGALRTETRPVALGLSNELEVEVVTGLEEGERVALLDAAGASAPAGGSAAAPGLRTVQPTGGTLGPR